ncbi:MAG: SpoIID/LytB domain-containing protein [Bacillota bacterium]
MRLSSEKGIFRVVSAVFMALLATLLPYSAEGAVSVTPKTIRVGLAQDVQTQDFHVRGKYRLIDRQTGEVLSEVLPGERWQVRFVGGKLQLYKNGQMKMTTDGSLGLDQVNRLVAVLSGDGTLKNVSSAEAVSAAGAGGAVSSLRFDAGSVNVVTSSGKYSLRGGQDLNLVGLVFGDRVQNYRGEVEFRPQFKGITVVNELPLEEYLYGVLPREMPAFWPVEALRAQAVSARSYAVAQLGTYRNYGFDLLASQMSQMYGGYDAEHSNTTRAVNETRDQVLLCKGKPISAFFHSSSGGYIEDSRDVWAEPLEYIKGKADPYDRNDAHYNWSVSYSMEQLVRQLTDRKGYYNSPKEPEKVFSSIDDIEIVEKTSTGARIKKIRITGLGTDKKPFKVEISNADAVRAALGLKSALFSMKKETGPDKKISKVTFTGSGYGHGLGLSQYGAYGMAGKGYNYQDILKYYYSNSEIGPIAGY